MAIAVRVKERRVRFASAECGVNSLKAVQCAIDWHEDPASALGLGPRDAALVRVPAARTSLGSKSDRNWSPGAVRGKPFRYAVARDSLALAELLEHGSTVKLVDLDSLDLNGGAGARAGTRISGSTNGADMGSADVGGSRVSQTQQLRWWTVIECEREEGIQQFLEILRAQNAGARVTALAAATVIRHYERTASGEAGHLGQLVEVADEDSDGALSLDEFLVFRKLVQRCGAAVQDGESPTPVPNAVPEQLVESLRTCVEGAFDSGPTLPPESSGIRVPTHRQQRDVSGTSAAALSASIQTPASSKAGVTADSSAVNGSTSAVHRTDKTMDADEEAEFEALRHERGRGFAFCADDIPQNPSEGANLAAAARRISRRTEDYPPETASGSLPRSKSKTNGTHDARLFGNDPAAAGVACVKLEASPRNVPSRRFAIGWADTIGVRMSMEDCLFVSGDIAGLSSPTDFVGVFDGHGGPDVARFVAGALPILFSTKSSKQEDSSHSDTPDGAIGVDSSLANDLVRIFRAANDLAHEYKVSGGATGCVCLIVDHVVHVANVGDTRCVLAEWTSPNASPKSGKKLSELTSLRGRRLTVDHKPSLSSENERIVALGGSVVSVTDRDGGVISRISSSAGNLAVSRAFGDFTFHPYVTVDPHVESASLADCPFIIIACDGVWDVLTDDDAVREVYSALFANRKHDDWGAQAAAVRLRDLAWIRGSDDNITAVVISLRKL